MRISKQLPRFKEQPAFIVLIGGKSMRAYRAAEGRVEVIAEYLHTEPGYTDREGFFSSRAHGKNLGGGVGEKRVKQIEHDHFIAALKKRLVELLKDRSAALYFFVAKHLVHDVEDMLPQHAKKRILDTIIGNHVHDHPFALLERIQQRAQKKAASEKLKHEPTEVKDLLSRKS